MLGQKNNRLFKTGIFISVSFTLIGVLGYYLTTDTTPNANLIKPEWASLKPGAKVFFFQGKRKTARSIFYGFWGDESLGEQISVDLSFKVTNDGKNWHYKSLKTGLVEEIDIKLVEDELHEKTFWLGSDIFGRDVMSRLIIGTRISLSIGLLSMVLSLVIGITIGLCAGYFGGWVDKVLSWLITVFWSVPTLLLALGLSVFLGKGYFQVLIATGLSTWVEVARVVRGQTLELSKREFILSSKITGFGSFHIMFKHILPNLTGTLTVLATTNFASAILLEAGLGFLGLGVEPPIPSWGTMVKENLGYLVLDQAYLAIIPGVAIMILVMSFNLLTMGLRDYFSEDSY